MADDRYSLKYAAFNESGLAFGNTSPTNGVSAQGTFARDQLSGLDLALEKLGLKLGLLTTAIESLTVKLSAQRLFSQTMGAGTKGESANEPKGKSGGGIEPPALLKPAIAMDAAMADLKQAGHFTPRQIAEMAEPTQRIASAPLVAAGGTTAVEVVRMQSLAARAGVGSDLPNASDRQLALLRFASDAGVTASTFKMPAMEAAEMLLGWRTSMKLSAEKAFDLADATNHLSKIPGGAKASEIGTVLQRDGAAATSAGLQPAQAAALTAALLNTGAQQAEAGVALDHFTTALGKGDQASATEQAAWKQLGLDPKEVASGLRDKDAAPGTVMSVLAALNAQPTEKRSSLASSLFGSGDAAVLRMSQKLDDVNAAFWQVKDPGQYATSQLDNNGSVRQDALALSNTRQGQLNVLNARSERLSLATGNALMPSADTSFQWLGSLADGMSELAESSPKAAAAIVLIGAAIKPLVGALLKAVGDEMSNQVAKRVLGKVAPHLPGRLGEVISEDFRNPRGDKLDTRNATQRPESPSGTKIRVSTRGSLGGAGRFSLGSTASLRSMTRRAPGPLKVVGAVADVAEGVLTGDKRMMSAGLGAAGGGWAGAAAGSAAGAALGSVVPVIGTAIGGLVGGLLGGWLGSDAGASLGEKLVAPADRLAAPDQVSKDLASTQTTTQQNTMTANIYINGQDQASASQLANLVVQQLSGQFGLMTMPNSLAMRSDAALTDGGT
ncbi:MULTISPECIES: phage tail tape measure protein [unclassified Pseudomonas]|uniref:phage tail tape measure protein n=1 Tax=unclassified Pseudomonas TaxID=196821 RepID=UPI0008767701|nr:MULTISPECIES: phage tail tape measure protein [unclassified Pseudomonas]SCZ24927.1 phage tail tape measure protein, TP901 family, core region [Pseudomonas sp. NFACC44-2]SDA65789.1 phage tail tape measure protein, TP901 family, core region [Pseudomonas sp. NFACC51]SEI95407.1 phage tail tape measure protein, TP901 family, core region [Pseudomonas sp. NFACC07-1]SFI44225.1 phage tail tape measure protein, TP901 family, core region [Pseudomonas sp. NFACC54]SFS54815.1 phage tail tape measure prot